MKHALVVLIVVMIACGFLLAQEASPPPGATSAQQQVPSPERQAPVSAPAQTSGIATPAANNARIAPGSVIPVQLTKTVDAKKVKKGDEVVAKVTQNLHANSGQVIVPKDTKVVGHVIEAQPRSKEQKESQLAIAFDRIDIKGGETVQLPMSIQAIIAPPNRNPASAGNSGGATEAAPASPGMATGAPATGAGARGGMGENPPIPPSTPQNTGNMPAESQGSAAQAPITGNTKGVVGIPNLTLSAAPGASLGSIVTSEKNNVKLEDGTFLLLRVNPEGRQNPGTPQNPSAPQNPQK